MGGAARGVRQHRRPLHQPAPVLARPARKCRCRRPLSLARLAEAGVAMRTTLARARAWAARNLVELCVVFVCFLIGGLPGLVVGAAGQAAVHRRGPRVAAAAAVCALVIAALATAIAPWSGH